MNDSYIQLAEKFHVVEEENGLFDLTIKGHPFWQYMRYYVFEEINRDKSKVIFPKRKKAYAEKIKAFIGYFAYRLKFCFRRRRNVDVVLYTHNKTAVIDGKKVDFHVYPVAKALSEKFKIVIEQRYEFPIRKSDYPCEVLVTRPIYFYSRLKSLFVVYNSKEKAIFARLSSLINSEFGTNVDVFRLARNIYSWHLMCFNEYLRYFRKMRPSVIVFCDSGDTKPMIEAAHRFGVRVVDYQHGIISPVSLLYRYPDGVSAEKLKETNADCVLTFGEYWHRFLKCPSKPVSVGFPYYDYCNAKRIPSSRDQKSILVTSVMSARKALANLAGELSRLLPDFTVYYRLRPDEHDLPEEIYPAEFFRRANIKIIDGSDGSLYDYFARCKYLVSTNSMTLYEGMASGMKVFILKMAWYEEMKELYENKYAALVSSADEIVEAINNRKGPATVMPNSHLFKENSIQHVESALRELIGHE